MGLAPPWHPPARPPYSRRAPPERWPPRAALPPQSLRGRQSHALAGEGPVRGMVRAASTARVDPTADRPAANRRSAQPAPESASTVRGLPWPSPPLPSTRPVPPPLAPERAVPAAPQVVVYAAALGRGGAAQGRRARQAPSRPASSDGRLRPASSDGRLRRRRAASPGECHGTDHPVLARVRGRRHASTLSGMRPGHQWAPGAEPARPLASCLLPGPCPTCGATAARPSPRGPGRMRSALLELGRVVPGPIKYRRFEAPWRLSRDGWKGRTQGMCRAAWPS